MMASLSVTCACIGFGIGAAVRVGIGAFLAVGTGFGVGGSSSVLASVLLDGSAGGHSGSFGLAKDAFKKALTPNESSSSESVMGVFGLFDVMRVFMRVFG